MTQKPVRLGNVRRNSLRSWHSLIRRGRTSIVSVAERPEYSLRIKRVVALSGSDRHLRKGYFNVDVPELLGGFGILGGVADDVLCGDFASDVGNGFEDRAGNRGC